jgi:uncharacterized delta-60 repeat protein
MPGYTNNSASWTKTAPWGKSSGVWNKAKEAYANVSGTWKQWWLDGGVNDRTFTESDNLSGLNEPVVLTAIQSDGKIVIGGEFTTFNGVTANNIIRLNSDGTRDASFNANTGSGFNNSVNSMAIQSDGKIIVGGNFTTFNGVTVNGIVRLNSDGTRDTAFTTNTGTGFSYYSSTFSLLFGIAIQSDGKIVIVGFFTEFNGATVNFIVRLNSDGTRDTTFTTNNGSGFNDYTLSVAIQSDGKIVIGGNFTYLNNTATNRIVRLNSNGTIDTAFATNTGSGANESVSSLAIQSDGKIIVGGSFTTFNGVTVNRIVRLNSDGTRDASFNANTGSGFDNRPYSMAIQSDGKIIVGGLLATFNGTAVNYIVRLNSNGTRDTTFTTNMGTGLNYPTFGTGGVYSLAIQSDGKIFVGGNFTSLNNTATNYIVRLNSDATRDTTFITNIGSGFNRGVRSLGVQSNGKIFVIGDFTSLNGAGVSGCVRLNSNGTLDTVFATSIDSGGVGETWSVAFQPDNKIIIGGYFRTFNGTAANGIVRLNSDDTTDTAFTANIGTGFNIGAGYAPGPGLIVIQSDGKIVMGGAFATFNGVTVNYIVRLNSNGTRDTGFTANTGSGFNNATMSIAIQSDGKIVIGGAFTTLNGTTVSRRNCTLKF